VLAKRGRGGWHGCGCGASWQQDGTDRQSGREEDTDWIHGQSFGSGECAWSICGPDGGDFSSQQDPAASSTL